MSTSLLHFFTAKGKTTIAQGSHAPTKTQDSQAWDPITLVVTFWICEDSITSLCLSCEDLIMSFV